MLLTQQKLKMQLQRRCALFSDSNCKLPYFVSPEPPHQTSLLPVGDVLILLLYPGIEFSSFTTSILTVYAMCR